MNCIHIEWEWAWRLGTTEAEIPRRESGDIEEEEEKGWRRNRRKRQGKWLNQSFGGFMFTRCLMTSKDGFRQEDPQINKLIPCFSPQNSISHSQTLSGWRRRLWGRRRCSRIPRQVRRKSLQLSLSPLFHLAVEHRLPAAGHYPSQLSKIPQKKGKMPSLIWL